jgi:hypothetical protein
MRLKFFQAVGAKKFVAELSIGEADGCSTEKRGKNNG